MTEKTQTKLAIGRMVEGQLHVLGIIEPFVSSRLGPDVSCETERERDAERSVVESWVAAMGDRQ